MEKKLKMSKPSELLNLSEVSKSYDVFFIDLWGVVHNGVKLFNDIIDVLQNLKKEKKKIFFLTNAPRRAAVINEQLKDFGLSDELYDFVVSSGEITWQKLNSNKKEGQKNCFLIGPKRDFHLIEGLDLKVTNDPNLTDIILNTGPWGDDDVLENYTSILENLVKKNPIMICSNPDKTVVRGDRFMICAGTLADYYEKIGGSVEYYGKPFKQIYEFCFKIIEKNKKVLVIGDSLENDIAGANNQNLDSILITSGIHRQVNNESGIDIKKLDDLMEKKKIFPKYFMKVLSY
ncbi:MAG: TIGR01459 family HAD-type hydrolase [Rickettsiales bacterium]|nr:TIGR01459 family HAD-type hydrolase [Rickettsiales bacterium]